MVLALFCVGSEEYRGDRPDLERRFSEHPASLLWPPTEAWVMFVSRDSDERLYHQYASLILGRPADLAYIARRQSKPVEALRVRPGEMPRLPFRDFSYVAQVICKEVGITGARDTAVLVRLMQAGGNDPSAPAPYPAGWMADPYDKEIKTPLARNLSEDSAYDAEFPDHPLSRARCALARIEVTLKLSPELKTEPRFVGPASRA